MQYQAQQSGHQPAVLAIPKEGIVCDTKYVKVVEDRPIEKEIVERIIEHHAFEKKFVVETRPAGEHELPDEQKASVSSIPVNDMQPP